MTFTKWVENDLALRLFLDELDTRGHRVISVVPLYSDDYTPFRYFITYKKKDV